MDNWNWCWSFIAVICSFVTSFYVFNSKQSQSPQSLQKEEAQISTENPTKTPTESNESKYIVALAKVSPFIPRYLKPQFHKKKLVLDLDETLISSSNKHSPKHDISVRINVGGVLSTFFVRKRPHVDLFLEKVSEMFEVIVFTASISSYANAVIDKLDPKGLISRRFYRQSCVNKAGSYIKDLQIICKDLSKIVIIDNSPVAFSCNKENGIPIEDWLGSNPQDQALLNLIPLLEELRVSNDVREVLKTSPKALCHSNKARVK